MAKNSTREQPSSIHYYQYYFIAAAAATAIAGIVHLYMPLAHLRMFENIPMVTFFLGSGIVQIFWILSKNGRECRQFY